MLYAYFSGWLNLLEILFQYAPQVFSPSILKLSTYTKLRNWTEFNGQWSLFRYFTNYSFRGIQTKSWRFIKIFCPRKTLFHIQDVWFIWKSEKRGSGCPIRCLMQKLHYWMVFFPLGMHLSINLLSNTDISITHFVYFEEAGERFPSKGKLQVFWNVSVFINAFA